DLCLEGKEEEAVTVAPKKKAVNSFSYNPKAPKLQSQV
nr:hypothetical protein [Tanacetum cinerariifolium]